MELMGFFCYYVLITQLFGDKIVDISKCFLFQEELALLRGHERPSLDMTEVKCRVFYFMASIKALKEVVQRARDMFKCLFL